MSSKISKQVTVARSTVLVTTPLTEEALQVVVKYVDEKFNRHEKAIVYKSDEEKKLDALVITLLDVTAELISSRQEIKRLRQSDSETLAAVDVLNKRLDDCLDEI